MISYRIAIPQDAHNLKMLNDLFNGEGCNSAQAIAESLMNNRQEIVCVAEDDKRLIGFCCGQVFKSMCYNASYGEITELFVLECYRRKNIGKTLMSFMETEFSRLGLKDFQLFTGKENDGAQAFYKSIEYQETQEMMFRKRI